MHDRNIRGIGIALCLLTLLLSLSGCGSLKVYCDFATQKVTKISFEDLQVNDKVIMCIRSSEMENFRSGGNEENTLKVEQLQLYTQRPAEWVSAVQRCIEALRSSQRA